MERVKVYENIETSTYYLDGTNPEIPNCDGYMAEYTNFKSKKELTDFINIKIDEIIEKYNGNKNKVEIVKNKNVFSFEFSVNNEDENIFVEYKCSISYSL
jgi:hypothetical protein